LGGAYVLQTEFDGIRRFIRYGEGSGPNFAKVNPLPFLEDERGMGNWSITDAHLVGVERNVHGVVLGHVSLFNLLHHEIVLAGGLEERIHNPGLPSGRIFFWESGRICPIRAWGRENLVQPYAALPHNLRSPRRVRR
jgi:hypothetical protein